MLPATNYLSARLPHTFKYCVCHAVLRWHFSDPERPAGGVSLWVAFMGQRQIVHCNFLLESFGSMNWLPLFASLYRERVLVKKKSNLFTKSLFNINCYILVVLTERCRVFKILEKNFKDKRHSHRNKVNLNSILTNSERLYPTPPSPL